MLIARNTTRVVYNGSEVSQELRTTAQDTVGLPITTAQFLYVGYHQRFSTRYFQLATANTNPLNIFVEYWDGSAWQDVEDFIDQTDGFTKSGFLSWENKANWKESVQSPVEPELFWVRVSVDANASAGTTLQSLLNIFCDDLLLRAYYPELITDSRFLPTGRTNFLEQYVAAKDLVALRLRQDGLIREEAQIIDINEVAIAAVHAAAWVILNPIARDAGDIEAAQRAFQDFTRELNRVKLDLDFNDDGVITDEELNEGDVFIKRG